MKSDTAMTDAPNNQQMPDGGQLIVGRAMRRKTKKPLPKFDKIQYKLIFKNEKIQNNNYNIDESIKPKIRQPISLFSSGSHEISQWDMCPKKYTKDQGSQLEE